MISQRLRLHAIGLLGLFAVQFVVGMTLNLFVSLPTSHPGTSGGEYFTRSAQSLIWAISGGGGWALAIHVLLAVVLLLGCLVLFVRSLRLKAPSFWCWMGGLASLFTLGALFNGLSFVDYDNDFSSLIMAVCWLAAVVALVAALLRAGPDTE